MSAHEHDWLPIWRWSGRYRCSTCLAIGYRPNVRPNVLPLRLRSNSSDAIKLYACDVPKCRAPAVRRKPQRCAQHKE